MDIFLSKVTQQAMNYAIRSGVTITASYAIRQSTRLLRNVPKSVERDELLTLQQRLQSKIRIISPAIDMIELIAARGNTSLESAVSLTKELRWDIQSLGQRLAKAAASEESARKGGGSVRAKAVNELEINLIIADIKKLLDRIEDAVPLINLAITTSGASLSTTLPSAVSPSRLLQASTFLTAGDTQYSLSPHKAVQVGPTFTLSVYMLFAGHVRPHDENGMRETTWKEVMHRASVKLRRVPMSVALGSDISVMPSLACDSDAGEGFDFRIPAEARADEFAYQMMLIEDLNDDRVHSFEHDEPQPVRFDDVELAGIREVFPIHQVSKIFYADTGKVLNIGSDGETNNPVLLLKRDLKAVPPRRMMAKEEYEDDNDEVNHAGGAVTSGDPGSEARERSSPAADRWRLPPGLDPEWIALEVYTEADNSDDDSETESTPPGVLESNSAAPIEHQLAGSMSSLHINGGSPSALPSPNATHHHLPISSSRLTITQPPPWANSIRTSLSLLELLLRLTSLQQFQQQSHLSITDELLNFFLEESATTGAGGDEVHRQKLRADARRRVGWDPYDESPMKRRGEDYQYQTASPQWDAGGHSDERGALNPPSMQTRSMTGMSNAGSPTPSPSPPVQSKDKKTWLKRREERRGSPLRPQIRVSDEGIGTSPASGEEK